MTDQTTTIPLPNGTLTVDTTTLTAAVDALTLAAAVNPTTLAQAITTALSNSTFTPSVPAKPTPSADKTVIKAGGTITDSAGTAWGINSGGLVTKNGVADATTANVTQLGYFSGVLWQENQAGGTWAWLNNAWVGGTSPFAQPVTPPAPAGSLCPTITVKGNQWLANGQPFTPYGSNCFGPEYATIGGNEDIFDGHSLKSAIAFAVKNKMNGIRVCMNAATYLGLTVMDVNTAGNGWVGNPYNADPYFGTAQSVQSQILAAFKQIQAAGLWILVDLHWCSSWMTFNGVSAYVSPKGQSPMPDQAMGRLFWKKIFATFGTGAPAIPGLNLGGFVFEWHNEPFVGDEILWGKPSGAIYIAAGGSTSVQALGNAMRVSGTANRFYWQDYAGPSITVMQTWDTYGTQDFCNDARAAGAANVLQINADGWAAAMQSWQSYVPTDPLKQIALGQHSYAVGSFPYSDGNVAPTTAPDSPSGGPNWDVNMLAAWNAGYAINISEAGGGGGATSASQGEPFFAALIALSKKYGIGLFPWQGIIPEGIDNQGTNYCVAALGPSGKEDGADWVPSIGEGQVFCGYTSSRASAYSV